MGDGVDRVERSHSTLCKPFGLGVACSFKTQEDTPIALGKGFMWAFVGYCFVSTKNSILWHHSTLLSRAV